MNKSFLVQLLTDELFLGSDIVRRFTFKMINTRDSYALFQKSDCFECLSPHKIAA